MYEDCLLENEKRSPFKITDCLKLDETKDIEG